jgi:hypothetical protein
MHTNKRTRVFVLIAGIKVRVIYLRLMIIEPEEEHKNFFLNVLFFTRARVFITVCMDLLRRG